MFLSTSSGQCNLGQKQCAALEAASGNPACGLEPALPPEGWVPLPWSPCFTLKTWNLWKPEFLSDHVDWGPTSPTPGTHWMFHDALRHYDPRVYLVQPKLTQLKHRYHRHGWKTVTQKHAFYQLNLLRAGIRQPRPLEYTSSGRYQSLPHLNRCGAFMVSGIKQFTEK